MVQTFCEEHGLLGYETRKKEQLKKQKAAAKRQDKKLQQDAYHIMQGMVGLQPGDPTYSTDLNPETYQKTM